MSGSSFFALCINFITFTYLFVASFESPRPLYFGLFGLCRGSGTKQNQIQNSYNNKNQKQKKKHPYKFTSLCFFSSLLTIWPGQFWSKSAVELGE